MDFDWDFANLEHIARHKLEPGDVEEAATDPAAVLRSAHRGPRQQPRFALIGATETGFVLHMVFEERGTKLRVVTARPNQSGDRPPRHTGGTPDLRAGGSMTSAKQPGPDEMIVIHSLDEIPDHMTEPEAAAFWDTHSISRELWAQGQTDSAAQAMAERLRGGQPRQAPRQPRQPKATFVTSLRLDEDMEKRLKKVAELKQVPYQTLLKQFVGERLYEEEKRLGVI